MDRGHLPSWLPGQGGKPLQAAGASLLRSFTRGRRQLAAAVRAATAALTSPALIVTALLLAGTGMGVAGVFIMWGLGPAMLAGCLFAFILAALIARGGGNA